MDDKIISIALTCNLEIAGQKFKAVLAKDDGGISYSGIWFDDGKDTFSLKTIADACGKVVLPEFLEKWKLSIESITVAGRTSNNELSFGINLTGGESLKFSTKTYSGKKISAIDFDSKKGLSFADIPFIGSILPEDSDFTLRNLHFTLGSSKEDMSVDVDATLKLFGEQFDITDKNQTDSANQVTASAGGNVPTASAGGNVPTASAGGNVPTASAGDSIKWININKSIKVLRINRVGIGLGGSAVKIFLDVGLNISIISIEFYGLNLTVPFGDGEFDFGLHGIFVSLDKPPVKLSGGLYKDPNPGRIMYNGMLRLQISDFSIMALGSYSEMKSGDKTVPSFFAYALLEKPLGGPSFFFVTGLALGMGINREIMLPKLEEVPKFPFVKAAMGGDGSGTDSSVDLSTLSDWVIPSEGSFFAAAGVKFSSFGIANSFAVIIAEFGKRTRISLLGQSILTMPPNMKRADKPVLYAELALRAVLDIDEGYFEVIAALTKNSYILHPDCKLQGGFLFCAWFKGERKGDFMISLGGCHHPLFKNKHKYPQVSKAGINWQISSNLSFKGSGYMAITPSCVMAGCSVSIDYRKGKLHAWLYASASFYMQWKPLFYDIRVGISIGIKYGIFKFELSCDLHLRGPEFAGELTVSVTVVSFTVRFGAWNSAPPALTWNQFTTEFLPKEGESPSSYAFVQSGSGTELSSLTIPGGIIREGKIVVGGIKKDKLFVRPIGFHIITHSAMPCTDFVFNNKAVSNQGLAKPSIAPMKLKKSYTLTHRVSFTNLPDSSDRFKVSVVTDSLSPAVWGNGAVDINAQPIKNLGTGLDIKLNDPLLSGILPADPNKNYKLSDLEDKTVLRYRWGAVEEEESQNLKYFDKFSKNPEQSKQLRQLSDVFGTSQNVIRKEIRENPSDYYWASFYACRTGQKIRY